MVSAPALQMVELIQSSSVYRLLTEEHPDLLALLIWAAEVAAKNPSDRAGLRDAVSRAISTSERGVEALCNGDCDDLAELMLQNSLANEDLGRLLKRLCPTALPIGLNSSMAPN